MGPLLVIVTILLATDEYVPSSPSEFASIGLFAVMRGWVIGAVERGALEFSLAALPGMFGDQTVPQEGSRRP